MLDVDYNFLGLVVGGGGGGSGTRSNIQGRIGAHVPHPSTLSGEWRSGFVETERDENQYAG